jgi:hypothetical protein
MAGLLVISANDEVRLRCPRASLFDASNNLLGAAHAKAEVRSYIEVKVPQPLKMRPACLIRKSLLTFSEFPEDWWLLVTREREAHTDGVRFDRPIYSRCLEVGIGRRLRI